MIFQFIEDFEKEYTNSGLARNTLAKKGDNEVDSKEEQSEFAER